MLRVTGPDIPQKRVVVERITSTYRRAKWLPEGRRGWTITPPPGTEPELTLDQILAERDLVRELYQQWERDGSPGIRDILGD